VWAISRNSAGNGLKYAVINREYVRFLADFVYLFTGKKYLLREHCVCVLRFRNVVNSLVPRFASRFAARIHLRKPEVYVNRSELCHTTSPC
jgi:hypothetical protein